MIRSGHVGGCVLARLTLRLCFRALAQRGGLPALEHLNLSGCLFITEVGLQELVSACPSLNDEHFYYCDNINGNTRESASFPPLPFFFPRKIILDFCPDCTWFIPNYLALSALTLRPYLTIRVYMIKHRF